MDEEKAKCNICSSEEETEEAIKAEKKIEKLEEEKDTGQHPVFSEERKFKPVNEDEEWRDFDAQ